VVHAFGLSPQWSGLPADGAQVACTTPSFSGKFEQVDVIVMKFDPTTETATVALAAFGGLDATPFELKTSNLLKKPNPNN